MVFLCFLALASTLNYDDVKDVGLGLQYHILNNGMLNGNQNEDLNVAPAWKQGYTGSGVQVSVVSEGCRTAHNDFADKASAYSYNAVDGSSNVFTTIEKSKTGTAQLSVAAANANGKGNVGVAPDASVSCNVYSSDKIADAVSKNYESVDVRVLPLIETVSEDDYSSTLKNMVEKGRSEKGVTLISAAGNNGHNGGDSNTIPFGCSPYSITVGASSIRGAPVYYTNNGACLSLNGLASGTTNEIGPNMSLFPAFTVSSSKDDRIEAAFIDTAVAAAEIAGVVALMYQANKDLTYRDVQMILQITASINDPKSPEWKENAANYKWNPRLGFGRADAERAVNVSKTWSTLAAQTVKTYTSSESTAIGYARTQETSIEIEVTDDIKFVEYLEIAFDTKLKNLKATRVALKSPSGTQFEVLKPAPYDIPTSKFGVRSFFGEKAKGKWVLTIYHAGYNTEDTVSNAKLTVYGTLESPTLPTITKRATTASEIPVSVPIQLQNSKYYINNKETAVTLNCNAEAGVRSSGEAPLNLNEFVLPYYVYDATTFDRFALGESLWEKSNNWNIPCIYAGTRKGYISSPFDLFDNSLTREVTIVNNANVEMSYPDPYSKATNSIQFRYGRQLKNRRPTSYGEKVLIDIWDMDTKKSIYTTAVFDLTAFDLPIPSTLKAEKAVVTVTPISYDDFSPCNTFLSPVSIGTASPGKFNLVLDSAVCPIPVEVQVDGQVHTRTKTLPLPTKIPSPSQSPSRSPRPTPKPTQKPDHSAGEDSDVSDDGKLKPQALILALVGVAVACVIILIAVVAFILARKYCKSCQKHEYDEGLDEKLNEDEAVDEGVL